MSSRFSTALRSLFSTRPSQPLLITNPQPPNQQLTLWPEEALRNRPPAKSLDQMTDEEAAFAVADALRFPFICKSCAVRVKTVDTSGHCARCHTHISSATIYTSTWQGLKY